MFLKGFKSFVFLFFLAFFMGCSNEEFDTSTITIPWSLERLDKDLFVPTQSYDSLNLTLWEKYGDFYDLFLSKILGEGSPENPTIQQNLRAFTNDRDVKMVYQEIEKTFGDFSTYEENLKNGFKRYSHYFPDQKTPALVLYHSQFSYGIALADSIVGIGLEMYLGTENAAIKLLPPEIFPNYKKAKMDPRFLVKDVLQGWIIANEEPLSEETDFLSDLVHHGKTYYVLSKCLPNEPIEVLFGYSKSQLEWCAANEKNMWEEIVKQNLLFSKDKKKTQRFFTDGPFTSGFPHESPSKTGMWIGWRMVCDYMKENPVVSLEELMKEKNNRKILKQYQPN